MTKLEKTKTTYSAYSVDLGYIKIYYNGEEVDTYFPKYTQGRKWNYDFLDIMGNSYSQIWYQERYNILKQYSNIGSYDEFIKNHIIHIPDANGWHENKMYKFSQYNLSVERTEGRFQDSFKIEGYLIKS